MNTPPTERQLAICFFLSLSRAARDWSWVLKGMSKGEAKARLLTLHNAEKDLSNLLVRELGKEALDAFGDDAAMWTDVLSLLSKGTTSEKERFYCFLKAYMAGEIFDQEEEVKPAA
jgi:hypothetical protein